MTLARGDAALLSALFAYRYLTSGQLARRERRSNQVIRRLIRQRLRPGGFVVNLQRSPAEEAAYALGPEGFAFVAHELGCSVADIPARTVSTVRGYFWKHTVLVNDIRIAFDLATADAESPVVIQRTIPEWEVVPGTHRKAPHHERFALSERFKGPDGASYSHRPDCLFLMYARTAGPEQLVAVFLEADRNTEAMRRIRHKYEAYFLYWSKERYANAFGAVAMRVLFVLDDVQDRQRIHSMQEELRELARRHGGTAEAFRRCFRFARKRDLDNTTVLAQPIWWDADDNPRLFFQPVTPPPVREANPEAAA
ncbi:MAG: replication-relaxation family protein [Polyangiaceae bacterium]|nr:replication-relaxation family protein [Polyangiaceae bacterium]